LWCDEKVALSSAAYAVGLAASIGLNLLLLPSYGLQGAVWGTAGGNLVALLLMVAFAMYRGMVMHRGSWPALALPLAICLGAWCATITTLVTLVLIWRTDWVLSHAEKQQLLAFADGYWQRLKRFGPKSAPASGN
jgi:O-antigen/teichoic acid export membrane protein